MGSGVEIGHGGVVEVDPDDLRAAGMRILQASVEVQLAQQDLFLVPAAMDGARLGEVSWVWSVTAQLADVESALDATAGAVGTTADAYELAELRARLAMLDATDPSGAHIARQRIDELLRGDVRLAAAEKALRTEWEQGRADGFTPAPGAPLSSPETLAAAALLFASPAGFALLGTVRTGMWGLTRPVETLLGTVGGQHGVVPAARRLAPGSGRPVMVDGRSAGLAPKPGDILVASGASAPLRPGSGSAGAAPTSLSEAVARVPYGKGPQVRIETYTSEDGAKRFVAYVDGTRSNGVDGTDRDPWDMNSNLVSYLDHAESDAYRATVAALHDAGADATTPVDLVGYSQGGMITDLIAQSGDFDVQGVFTIGSPIEPALPGDVLDVAVRHTDDPVAGLAGGGSAGGTGSPDSLVITRTVAPGHGIDPHVPAHLYEGYRETVRRAEISGDPRLDVIRAHFASLEGTTMTSTDYTATRRGGEG